MILNTGSRTDIPAFFHKWFLNRIREGFVYVRNPYDPARITEYTLTPELVDLICFCSKNPAPLLPHLDELADYNLYWHVTMTPYGKDIEPFVPPYEEVTESIQELGKRFGPKSVAWRYDPIFLTPQYNADFHIETFRTMAESLRGYTDRVILSFLDLYEKTKRNFPEGREVLPKERLYLGEHMQQIAAENGMTLAPCLEGDDLAQFGADTNGCMTQAVLERSLGESLSVPSMSYAREGCKCLLGNDIGAYNTCLHGCRYCYANYDTKTVHENVRHHDPESPLLIGHVRPEDTILPAKQVSYLTGQLGLF